MATSINETSTSAETGSVNLASAGNVTQESTLSACILSNAGTQRGEDITGVVQNKERSQDIESSIRTPIMYGSLPSEGRRQRPGSAHPASIRANDHPGLDENRKKYTIQPLNESISEQSAVRLNGQQITSTTTREPAHRRHLRQSSYTRIGDNITSVVTEDNDLDVGLQIEVGLCARSIELWFRLCIASELALVS